MTATATTTTTSQAQIDANRANSQLSTGPKTEEGLRASSANSIRSGLTAVKLFVRAEEQEEFELTRQSLMEQLQPSGLMQGHLFDRILHAMWNIQRCTVLEAALQAEAFDRGVLDALLEDELGRKLDRIYRYRKMHESAQRQATAEFRRLKTEEHSRNSRGDAKNESVLIETQKIATALSRAKAGQAKRDMDLFRAELAAFVKPPVRVPAPVTAIDSQAPAA